jgi:hypothetical protein
MKYLVVLEHGTPYLDLFDHLKAATVLIAAFMLGFADVAGLGQLMAESGRQVAALGTITFDFGSR